MTAPAIGILYCDTTNVVQATDQKRLVNAQTGTSYTVLNTDRGKLVTFTNGSAVAVTLPQAGASAQFTKGWFCDVQNRGAGAVTITPTTSTIDGAASLVLVQNAGVRIFSGDVPVVVEIGRQASIASGR
jgi:hypothetical protein